RARRDPVLGGELIGEHDVLPYRFEGKPAARRGDDRVVVAHAVDQVRVVSTELSRGVHVAATDTRHAGRHVREAEKVAIDERNRVEIAARDGRADGVLRDVHERRGGGRRGGLLHRGDGGGG